jgi:hypothetical protein
MKKEFMLRPLFSGNIRQSIENQMLCLTDLANIYEAERLANGWNEKRLDKFFDNSSEVEYILELLDLQGFFINGNFLTFTEYVKSQGIINGLKSIGQYRVTGRAENKAVFINPYIFIAVAQWLNPRFRAYVTIWATDQLILNRIDAGSEYNKLCRCIADVLVPKLSSENEKKFIFSNFAKLINKKVFGKHDENLRQLATKEQLANLKETEIKLTTLIEVGFINNYSDAKAYLFKE